jgi:hypothetical protein
VLIEQGDHIAVQMITGSTRSLGELRHRAKVLAQRGTGSQEDVREGRNEQVPTQARGSPI